MDASIRSSKPPDNQEEVADVVEISEGRQAYVYSKHHGQNLSDLNNV